MPFYHTLGADPAQAAHRLPQAGRRPVRRGADGARGVHRHVVAALPRPSADDGEVGAAAAGDDVRGGPRSRRSGTGTSARRGVKPQGGSPTLDRIPLLFNQRHRDALRASPTGRDEHFYRNAQADEVVYVAEGQRRARDAVRRPAVRRGRLPRHPPRHHAPLAVRHAGEQPKLLVFESRGHVRTPKRYRNEFGQLMEGAPYCERDIRRPGGAAHARREGRLPHPRQAVRRPQRDGSSTTIRSTSSAGTATSIRGRSTSTTSSRSSDASTSRRRCTRRSRATAS